MSRKDKAADSSESYSDDDAPAASKASSTVSEEKESTAVQKPVSKAASKPTAAKAIKVPEEKKSKSSRLESKYALFAGVFIVGIIMGLAASPALTGNVASAGPGLSDAGEDAVGAKVITFLQSRLSTAYPGIDVKLSSVRQYLNIPGTYQVNTNITYQDQSQVVPYYATQDGKIMFSAVVDLNEPLPEPTTQPEPQTQPETGIQANQPANPAITTFFDSGEPVCTENGKPVIRLFSTTWCPHCKWISETYEKVVKEYVAQGKIVAYHWELDINDNTLTDETESSIPDSENAIYATFNPGGSIPTFVFGCKYYRVGNGHESQNDLAAEEVEFRAVINDLLAPA